MSLLLATLAILTGFALGVWLYLNYSDGASSTYDAWATVVSVFYVATGIFLVLGGFEIVGLLVIATFVWIGASKGEKTTSNLRRRIAD